MFNFHLFSNYQALAVTSIIEKISLSGFVLVEFFFSGNCVPVASDAYIKSCMFLVAHIIYQF